MVTQVKLDWRKRRVKIVRGQVSRTYTNVSASSLTRVGHAIRRARGTLRVVGGRKYFRRFA